MSRQKKEPSGCGCLNIPISVILLIVGGGCWLFTQRDSLGISKFLPNTQPINIPFVSSTPTPTVASNSQKITPKASPIPTPTPTTTASPSPNIKTQNKQASPKPKTPPQTPWEKKQIRGIYLSRYNITNNASEQMIREKVRYYRAQGFNTIIHGVWGNACTMYKSEVMQQTLGFKSCPNLFRDKWLDWLIDEAHKQGMEVHAYFEKGIKIDKNSPIFDLAISKKWIVPGVDKTYAGIDHYVLDVELRG